MKRIVSILLALLILWLPVSVSAKTTLTGTLSLADTLADPAAEFKVSLFVKENPSLAAATLQVEYDAGILEAVRLETGDLSSEVSSSASLASPFRMTTLNESADVSREAGVLVRLVFRFKAGTEIGTTAEIRISSVEAWNEDGFAVSFAPVSATVTASERSNSDLTEDGVTSSADAIHLLYHVLFGQTRYPVAGRPDFNADGAVNSSDAIYLLYHVLFGQTRYPI